ncbi:MAG: E3 ubiquitin protein ligase [bacterium]|nr:MAG: E3 ubiquitin protein ligase [bacterium]
MIISELICLGFFVIFAFMGKIFNIETIFHIETSHLAKLSLFLLIAIPIMVGVEGLQECDINSMIKMNKEKKKFLRAVIYVSLVIFVSIFIIGIIFRSDSTVILYNALWWSLVFFLESIPALIFGFNESDGVPNNKKRRTAKKSTFSAYPISKPLKNPLPHDFDLEEDFQFFLVQNQAASSIIIKSIDNRAPFTKKFEIVGSASSIDPITDAKEIIGYCQVCHLSMDVSEDTLKCPKCSNLSHKSHFLEWLKIKGYCPSCYNAFTMKDFGI